MSEYTNHPVEAEGGGRALLYVVDVRVVGGGRVGEDFVVGL